MKKGFTLIELLAVIVILAIIALIATPIILGIINDAREEANERSFDLYASAVRNAIAAYQLKNPNDVPTDFSQLDVETDGGEVVCEIKKLHADGSFYLADCTVNETDVDYTYGLPYKPQYYGWFLESENIYIGETEIPAGASTVPPIGKNVYVGYDVTEGIISTGYVCFVKNGIEYCLKNGTTEDYKTNKVVLEGLCGHDVEGTDNLGNKINICTLDDLVADSSGIGVSATVGSDKCYVSCFGSCWFSCSEE